MQHEEVNEERLILETENLCKDIMCMVHELGLEPMEMNPEDFWIYIKVTSECICQWWYLTLDGTAYMLAEEVLDKDYPLNVSFYFSPPEDAPEKVQVTESIRQAELNILGEYYPDSDFIGDNN